MFSKAKIEPVFHFISDGDEYYAEENVSPNAACESMLEITLNCSQPSLMTYFFNHCFQFPRYFMMDSTRCTYEPCSVRSRGRFPKSTEKPRLFIPHGPGILHSHWSSRHKDRVQYLVSNIELASSMYIVIFEISLRFFETALKCFMSI